MLHDDRYQERRSDHDVTNRVNVSSPVAVRDAVAVIFTDVFPRDSFDPVWLAFHDFERFFRGLDPDYHGVDTSYHDMQHTLDMTLALARLIAGYERTVAAQDRLGPDRARLGLITALFHDSGYLRHRRNDTRSRNGAEFTLTHVTRSARFLSAYLPTLGLESYAAVAEQVVHFTGYEIDLDSIELDDPIDSTIGHLLGTADLLAQIADRCYLEKCRDRLFAEFVLGGIAIEESPSGTFVRYRSGKDLLSKTLTFYEVFAKNRLERTFNRAYRYLEAYFEEENPYIVFIQRNLDYLEHVLRTGQWSGLRRRAPCSTPDPRSEARLMSLALQRIQSLAQSQKIVLKGGGRLQPALGY